MKFFTVCKGTTRKVILILSLGIVIKIARFEVWYFLENLRFSWDLASRKSLLPRIISTISSRLVRHNLKLNVFAGIIANTREFLFWIKYRNQFPFLSPTLFSCGLFNVQIYSVELNFPEQDMSINRLVERIFFKHIGDDIISDGHTLIVSDNFGRDRNNRVVLRDYGSTRTQELFLKIPQKITTTFEKLTAVARFLSEK